MPGHTRPDDLLAGRYRLIDLLNESRGGSFWRAYDQVLARDVAVHVIGAEDERAAGLLAAARLSATVNERRLLRVLDADQHDDICYVVNEWGTGTSLDIMLANDGPLGPRRAAWILSEVGAAIATAHAAGAAHGRLNPENVLIDHAGNVRLVGFAVDAALRGLPVGRQSTDVVDLASVLYAALTGKWPGISSSQVPPAPHHGGRVLRPSKVRAGIPRPLDHLCDRVINPHAPINGGLHLRTPHDLGTARGITEALRQYVGDTAAIAAEEQSRHPGPRRFVDAFDELAHLDDLPIPAPAPDPVLTSGIDQPTQAGVPIFDDLDDVSWLSPRSDPPPPPPPFEQPPDRPLFAPDSAPGSRGIGSEPARTPRPGSQDEYWPWDTFTGTGTGTGTGIGPAQTADQHRLPGRSWMRLAAGIAAAALVFVAVVFAYHLGSEDRTPLEPESEASPSQQGAGVLPVAGVVDLDPEDESGTEYPELVGATVDGDASTSWRTHTYYQDFGPGGLKSGLGLVFDLGEARSVSGIELTFVGAPTAFAVYVSDERPDQVGDLTPVASETATAERHVASWDPAVEGRFVTLWLTSIPPIAEGEFRGEVAEVAIHG